MRFSTATLAVAALVAGASAHMNMASPPPLKYKGNPNAKTIDSDITSPNVPSTFPCKGALDVFDSAEGASVATWAPGSQQTVKIEGGANHGGGSCQISLSYDSGSTWTAIYSKQGNCPVDTNLAFTVPSDAPTGDKVLLGWTWINHTGNREFYMNCASITIAGSSSKREEIESAAKPAKRETAFSSRPAMFVANLEGKSDYCVKEGVDVLYPEPGPDVDTVGSSGGPPVNCDTGAAVTGSTGSGSGSGSGSSASATATAATSAVATTTAAATSSAAAATSAIATASVSMYVPSSSSSFLVTTTKGPFANSSVVSSTKTPNPTDLTVIPISKTESSVLIASSSSPGGVFVTSPSGGASSTAAQTTQQTTLQTKTTVISVPTSAAATKTSSAAPATGSGGAVSGSQTGACSDEGSWSCLSGGSSFQRCASGQWSAVVPMAAGTSCTPGTSDTLSIARRAMARPIRRSLTSWSM
ncbi:hypothetical protein TruAng_010471 [Truncatella angustata]|nr:hypothetical protein TruAng_010471 [Truncatella angustata]